MGISEALAAILALPGEKAALHHNPAGFQERYGLTAAELDVLKNASPWGLQLTNNEHRTVRYDTLRSVLPRTLRHLAHSSAARVGSYLEQVPWQTTSTLAEAQRFLGWLTAGGGVDPQLSDLANYELMLYEVAVSREATEYATTIGSAPPRTLSVTSHRPRISPAARISSFSHDVTATQPTKQAHPLHLLAVKTAERWGPKVYRLSEEAVRLLRLCDGRRTAAQIATLATTPDRARDTEAALQQFVRQGALSVLSPDIER
ncbi:PqqD family protein [Streptosporangium sp. OZ121]|uniref:PqqD family protein n=1 Tax=Streptosporangium sp. OZ121 TaxID=3444183 RepID=UPI003F78E7A4